MQEISELRFFLFQDQVKLTTGLDIKTPDWVKEAEEEDKETGARVSPFAVKEKAGSQINRKGEGL